MIRILTWIALAALACLVVVLATQNRSLREANGNLEQKLALMSSGPDVGAIAAPMRLTTTSGNAIEIGGPGSGPTVLYFFSTKCPYCRASLPQVHRIADSGARLVGIALRPFDEVDAYAERQQLSFAISSDKDGKVAKAYEANVTPLLLVIDKSGAVAFKHVGQIDDLTASTALHEAGLGAKLP
ncbi:TlpA disulfide reductase family protein [Stenotrophomonas sp.]|uniref:peroxiredoxin family protein n=1 Tax=Stenotrophomonas sp. TaxID=69392 RepID=UPI0028B25682|nr:TlpA disulfide reductase family protein [Stenotrophomonas sp.]